MTDIKPVVQLTRTIIHVEGKPLGRHRLINWHQVAKLIRADSTAIGTVSHASNLSTCLDQGALGSCTGNAVAHAASSRPYALKLTETDAVAIYSLATKDDNFPGVYPPTDTGSSGYFAMQAACELGYFKSFAMAVGLTAALQQLQTRCGITGVDWYEGMDDPDTSGRVQPTGSIRGGHEICIVGCDVEARLVWFQNSWGASYGVKYGNRDGCFCMTFDDYELLLASGGDATFAAVQ